GPESPPLSRPARSVRSKPDSVARPPWQRTHFAASSGPTDFLKRSRPRAILAAWSGSSGLSGSGLGGSAAGRSHTSPNPRTRPANTVGRRAGLKVVPKEQALITHPTRNLGG